MNRSDAGKLGYEKTREQLQQHALEKSIRAREAYETDPNFCLRCRDVIPYEKRRNKFCSKSCSAAYNNANVTRHIKGSKLCKCGQAKLPRNKYCSECASQYLYKRPSSIEEAKTDGFRKKFLLEVRGRRCEKCGLDRWLGEPIAIELHHVDGDTDNNSENNLQLLCPNCHAQSDTHKRRNKNGARQITRRKRYSEGKTW